MFKNIKIKISNILHNFIPDKNRRAFMQFAREKWNDWKVKNPTSVLLIEFTPNSSYTSIASYFANILARKHNSRIVGFVTTHRLWNIAAWRRIFASFNMTQIIRPHLTGKITKNKHIEIMKAWNQIKNKQDLFDFKYDGIWIGIDIYESYLREGKPTVNLKDPEVFILFTKAIELIQFWTAYFNRNKISAVIVCHDCYLNNIIVKSAYTNNVPVYIANLIYPTYSNAPFTFYRFCSNYHKYFSLISKKEQEEGLLIGKDLLTMRIGKNGNNNDSYEKTTFQVEIKKHRILKESNKLKVLICSHCFYDNPHGYAKLPFVDFYEWLEYIGSISRECDYDWYIKVHLDPLPGTMDVINTFLRRYPHITLIPNDSNPHQLAREGLNFVTTIHGTVGHEYPALGVQVLNAGFNPQIAYDFNWHAHSLEEYEYFLKNLHTLSKPIRIEEMYEFYFVNYRLCKLDDLLFPSFLSHYLSLPAHKLATSISFEAFLNECSQEKHEKVVSIIDEFIKSKRHHMFELKDIFDGSLLF
jgi:hypothetical protein